MTEAFINEFNEEITDDEVHRVASRLQRLPRQKIDEVWHRCGFILNNRAPDLKALSDQDVSAILGNILEAKERVSWLFQETPKEDVHFALETVERKL